MSSPHHPTRFYYRVAALIPTGKNQIKKRRSRGTSRGMKEGAGLASVAEALHVERHTGVVCVFVCFLNTNLTMSQTPQFSENRDNVLILYYHRPYLQTRPRWFGQMSPEGEPWPTFLSWLQERSWGPTLLSRMQGGKAGTMPALLPFALLILMSVSDT